MRIGIIVHSVSGKTKSIAEMLKDRAPDSYSVTVEEVKPTSDWKTGDKNVNLEVSPAIDGYDVLIIGAPIMAFSIDPVMKTYLTGIDSFNNKKIAVFATKSLPFYWTGGYQGLGKMSKICKEKNGIILVEKIIHNKKKIDEETFDEFAGSIYSLIR
ncbi:MAG: hypothetical protein ABF289_18500 [Clostridiales bacterium]